MDPVEAKLCAGCLKELGLDLQAERDASKKVLVCRECGNDTFRLRMEPGAPTWETETECTKCGSRVEPEMKE